MVDEKLLELLVCPNCKGEVVYNQDESTIACVGECKYVYPVVEGIPHMLIEEARKP
jgi:hypothetical protein